MERLSFFDQMMHKWGTAAYSPMNMQGAMIINPAAVDRDIDPKVLGQHIAERLSGFALLGKKLVQDPLKIGDMKLVDHAGYNAIEHITFSTIPRPGNQRALLRAIGRFSAQDLDHSRPPWRIEIMDGLEDDRLVVLYKLSHATMDGMTAARIFQSICDAAPQPLESYTRKDLEAQAEPGTARLLGQAVRETGQRAGVELPKVIFQFGKVLTQKAAERRKRAKDAKDGDDDGGSGLSRAPRTSLNRAVSPNKRLVAYINYDFKDLKALSKALDCTINDLSLLLVSEGFRHYFHSIGEEIDGDLVFIIPLDSRASAERSHGNEVGVDTVKVFSTIDDLEERLAAIKQETAAMKRRHSQPAGDDNGLGGAIAALPPIVIDLLFSIVRVSNSWNRLPTLVNAVVSNVPGSREGLYIAGMPIEYTLPIIPISHTCAVSVGATSIGNIFSFGFHACGDVVKERNMHFFIDGVDIAYRDLSALAKDRPAKPKRSRSTRKASSATPKAAKSKPVRAKKKAAAKSRPTTTKPALAKKKAATKAKLRKTPASQAGAGKTSAK